LLFIVLFSDTNLGLLMSDISKNNQLFSELKNLIDTSRSRVAVTVNAEMTMLYWNVGKRINTEILQNDRAEYGKQIVQTLSAQLMLEYGRGWGVKHLRHCLRFAETFPDEEIVYALRSQLSWTHFRSIMYIEDELKRNFYIEMCKLNKWSTRTLESRINSLLFERTAISKKGEDTILHDLDIISTLPFPHPKKNFSNSNFRFFLIYL